MQIKKSNVSDTEVVLTVVVSVQELQAMKDHVLGHFQSRLKVQGFREGKAPIALVEKNVDATQLQTEFLEETINQLYPQVIRSENLRPVQRPEISITKFVPFTTLEFEAKVAVIGEMKLPDYTKIRKAKPTASVTAEDIKGVLKSLQQRAAEKKDVNREAKSGDEVWIDFKGTDAKGQPINGADGKDYPIILGSNTFIPGFEDNVLGMKANDSKTFTLTFPKDYSVKALASKKVTFTVDVTKVQEVIEPKLDDSFASKIGPFKSLQDLKDDIKKQLTIEKQQQVDRDYESELVREVAKKAKITIPDVMINDHIQRLTQELQQNITYRGLTYEDFLKTEGKTEDKYREEVIKPQAEERAKISLILGDIADKEGLDITPEELDHRIELLRAQYQDPSMQLELEKPEARQDISSRMLTEKVIAKLVEHASKKK